MSNLEIKETNLNKLIDKLSNLSGTYSQSTSDNEKIKKEKQQLEGEKKELENKNQELIREHKYLKNKLMKLQEEVKSRDDEIVFLELQELVETARHTTDDLPPYWNKGVTIPISSDDYSTFESGSEPDDPPTARTNNEPCTHTGSGETERENYDNTITGPDRRTNDISARQAQNRSPDMPGPRLDEDESRNLRHIAETFENIRSDLVTAWNRAMIWVDDEVVFAKLNALLTVTKEATDRVIEATLRAEREANDEPGNAQANANKLSHNDTRDRQETAPVTTERLHATQNHP